MGGASVLLNLVSSTVNGAHFAKVASYQLGEVPHCAELAFLRFRWSMVMRSVCPQSVVSVPELMLALFQAPRLLLSSDTAATAAYNCTLPSNLIFTNIKRRRHAVSAPRRAR
jgi:hypothetical protein